MKKLKKTAKLYLYTFLGVGLSIFAIGFVGINFSLKYIQNRYIQIQLDVNKRQAEHMAYFLEGEIMRGIPVDTVAKRFQASIVGTQADKGFLCVYDTKQSHLICHPNPQAVGVQFTKDFVFTQADGTAESFMSDVYSKKQGMGGLFVQGQDRTDIVYTIPVKGTDWFLNAHENITVISNEIKLLRFKYILGSLILGVLTAIASTFAARTISRRYEIEIERQNITLDKNLKELTVLHKEVNEQKEEISTQRDQLQVQHDIVTVQRDQITHKNKLITDSINYAERIQAAVLPNTSLISSAFSEAFILYRPKDIVSGDFYWFFQQGNSLVVAAADCTGHGVPGAIMSMLGAAFLNEIVNSRKITQANLILDELRQKIKTALGQSGNIGEQQDGMDIALCVFDLANLKLEFSGANNPLYLIRQNKETQLFELHETKGDHMPVGIHPKDKNPFVSTQIQLETNDSLYIFSDGYTSQFGGAKNETFKSRRLQETLLAIQESDFTTQKIKLEMTLSEWMGMNHQVDDILVVGLKV